MYRARSIIIIPFLPHRTQPFIAQHILGLSDAPRDVGEWCGVLANTTLQQRARQYGYRGGWDAYGLPPAGGHALAYYVYTHFRFHTLMASGCGKWFITHAATRVQCVCSRHLLLYTHIHAMVRRQFIKRNAIH